MSLHCLKNIVIQFLTAIRITVKYWLTFNEINGGVTPLGTTLSLSTVRGYEGPVADAPVSPQVRFEALHHQLLASAKVVAYAHEHYPQFQMGI